MGTVILLQQCPLSVVENYAVAVYNINAVLLKKLLLLPLLLRPNACEFLPTGKGR
jgi:hypothetical protein